MPYFLRCTMKFRVWHCCSHHFCVVCILFIETFMCICWIPVLRLMLNHPGSRNSSESDCVFPTLSDVRWSNNERRPSNKSGSHSRCERAKPTTLQKMPEFSYDSSPRVQGLQNASQFDLKSAQLYLYNGVLQLYFKNLKLLPYSIRHWCHSWSHSVGSETAHSDSSQSRSAITFLPVGNHCHLAGTTLCCVVTEARVWITCPWSFKDSETARSWIWHPQCFQHYATLPCSFAYFL